MIDDGCVRGQLKSFEALACKDSATDVELPICCSEEVSLKLDEWDVCSGEQINKPANLSCVPAFFGTCKIDSFSGS